MNTIISFFGSILVFLHVISPISTPLPVVVPSATPLVSQRPVQKPVATPIATPKVDSPQTSKCKLEASLAVDKLSDVFVKSSESRLVNNPLYIQQQLVQKAKLQKLSVFESQNFAAYERTVVDRRDPAELEALLKILTNQLINSQKELEDNFSQLTAQQYNLVYLQCVNR